MIYLDDKASNNYDEDMKSSELNGLDTEALCEELMLRDVAAAADLLRPTYDATGRRRVREY